MLSSLKLANILVDLGTAAPTRQYSYTFSLSPSSILFLIASLVVLIGSSPGSSDNNPIGLATLDAGGDKYTYY